MAKTIEIMDTTLRDGEQTAGVAFTASEKLTLARMLLEEVKVDRLEIASARISEGEYEAVEKIVKWATEKNYLDRIEILGFVDGGKSLDWIKKSGAKVINLLTKGSLNHVQGQLKKTPEEHLADIKKSIAYAKELDISVNIYLEDWSNGMTSSQDYVFFMLDGLKDEPIKRFMLPDTLGILNPKTAFDFVKATVERYPELHFDSHLHNDYDLAIGNSFSVIEAGISGIHTTVNGLGERTGNTPLASAVALINDHTDHTTHVVESSLNRISGIVESFSGVEIPANKPVVGDFVFTQTCGVHADGDNKGGLYFNELMPERFGRKREYALGKTSGNASIRKNLEELGIELEPEALKKVTQRVVELGDQKETITKEDLPFIISEVLGTRQVAEEKVRLINYYTTAAWGMEPVANIKLEVDGKEYQQTANGDGMYDAFMKAVSSVYDVLGKEIARLKNYKISIPPGGRTDALVETVITWEFAGKEFKTKGLEADQQTAAVKATLKMLNLIEE